MKRESAHAPPTAKTNASPAVLPEGLLRIRAAEDALARAEERVAEARKRLNEETAERDRLQVALHVTIREETDPTPRLFS